ncbi:hypothetical protein QP157_08490 [Sphingomonas sp. LR61]|uniref:hypothetical protein n=1 Tax=Sphingomonas sp. LR61 TaxID=3050234 RepID=UPI002FE394D6
MPWRSGSPPPSWWRSAGGSAVSGSGSSPVWVFLLLPRVAWAGTEGRPYATVTTFAALLTLVGLTAVRRTRVRHHATRWWVVYGVLAAVAVLFNVYLSLAVVAHGVVLAWTGVADRAA